ncbi:hypothetical protein BKA61DRAFT_732203 [Leptodontidium sp. MPI-SDFR-AT-0119]|nr:hypothetical protein BKA61DRAFT_732203 [Leptodontidium sp. MPI-SDFR-AT-0119]
MHYSTLLKLASTFLLASSIHAYDMHCKCEHRGTTVTDITYKCCSEQRAMFELDYGTKGAECTKDALKFDASAFLHCCETFYASASCWAVA